MLNLALENPKFLSKNDQYNNHNQCPESECLKMAFILLFDRFLHAVLPVSFDEKGGFFWQGGGGVTFLLAVVDVTL